jgi:hypothetical protein
MSVIALAAALQDFGARRFAESFEMPPRPALEIVAASPPPPDFDAPEYQERLREEVERAETALEARLAEEHQAAFEAERQGHAEQVARLIATIGADAGSTIAEKFAEMENRIGELVTAATARILGGLLSEDVERRSLEELARIVRDAVGDRDAVRVQVRGPQSMFEALSAAVADRAKNLDFTEASGFDLSVEIDGNIIETRLSEWSAAISGILE